MCIIDLLKISPSEASKVPHGDLCSIGFANIFQQPKLFTFANNRFSSVQFSSVQSLSCVRLFVDNRLLHCKEGIKPQCK